MSGEKLHPEQEIVKENPFPYQKKSLILISPVTIATTAAILTINPDRPTVWIADNNPIPAKKYVIYTATT